MQKIKTWPYLAFQMFFSLLLWIPVFYEFQKKIGLNDNQIFNIQSWYYLFFVFFEIPTGYFSDRFGHKRCIQLGSLILAFSNTIPIWMDNFNGMLIHFLLIALARALLSGAASAYLYEYLQEHQAVDQYKQIEGQARYYALIARIIGWSTVGHLMQVNLYLPYYFTALITFMAFVMSFVMPNLNSKEHCHENRSIFNDFVVIPKIIYNTPILVLLMLQGVGIFLLTRISMVNLYQPILKMKDFNLEMFGILMAIMTAFEAIGAKYSHKVDGKEHKVLFAISSVLCFSFILLSFGGQLVTALGFIIFSFAAGMAFPLQKEIINKNITNGSYRATILSMESIIDRLVSAVVVSFVGGFIADGRLVDYLLFSAAGTFVVVVAVFFVLNKMSLGVVNENA